MKIKRRAILIAGLFLVLVFLPGGLINRFTIVHGEEKNLERVLIENYEPSYEKEKNDGYRYIKNIYNVGNKSFFEDLDIHEELDKDIVKELVQKLGKFESTGNLVGEYVYRLIDDPIVFEDWMILSIGRFENTQSLEEDGETLKVIESLSVIVQIDKLDIAIEGTNKFYEQLAILPEEVISSESKELIIKYRK